MWGKVMQGLEAEAEGVWNYVLGYHWRTLTEECV